jgi:hypothetical protein
MLPIQAQHLQHLERYRQQFANAAPFRHVVIDDFFDARFLAELIQAFPPFNPVMAKNENGEIGLKAVNERIRNLAPSYAELDDVLKSQAWLDWVGQVTGIEELCYDPHYFGGGTHDNLHGQDLDVHIDFNRHPLDQSHRRLNLIVYLNEGWQPHWGGQLQLHSDPQSPSNQITSINPIRNRCVIFETTESSWHAFDRINLPEDQRDQHRRSIAIYLYTRDRPVQETGPTHSTIYVDRPLPGYVQAGQQLSAEQAEEIRVLVTRRDHHIQRLYRDITGLTQQLENAKQALSGSRLRRLWWMLRRALGRT